MKSASYSVVFFFMSVLALTMSATSLPSGYSAIPYLQSDGKAYIDTGYCPKPSTRLDVRVAVKDMSGDEFIFGADDRKQKANMALWWESYNTGAGGFVETPGAAYAQPTSGNAGLKSTEYKNCRVQYAAGVFTLDNLDDGKTAVFDKSAAFAQNASTYEFTNSIYIFARHGSSGSMTGASGLHNQSRFTRFQIYEGETLVRDFVPAYEAAKVRLGLYDLANGVFYANAAATGSFTTEVTGGARKRLSYLGGTGTQYIETGYVFKKRPRVECLMYLNTTDDLDTMGNAANQAGCFIVDYKDGAKMLYYRYGKSDANASMTSGYTSGLKGNWVAAVYDTTVTHDGVQIGTEVQKANYDFSNNTQTFRIFKGRNFSQVRFSYVRVYDDDVLVRDYIPAEVDGTVGLWDRLTQTLSVNAGTGSFESGFAIPAQPGDFSVLEVVGSPANLGSAEPNYGQHSSVPGQSVTCTATAPQATATERVTLAGWQVAHDGVLQASGTTSPATFTAGDRVTTLTWLWGGEFYVSFVAGTHGTISATGGWYASGETVTVTATPDEDCEFVCWKGVPDGLERVNPLPLVVDGARTIEAVFTSSQAKRLEYIGSDGQQQYIDTGYVFTNRPAVVARMMMMDTSDTDFLGMPTAKADCFIVDYADNNAKLYYRYADASYTEAGYSSSSGKLIGKWFDCAWSNIVWHGNHKILDFSKNNYTGKFATNTQKFYLFRARNYGKVRYGEVKMYDGETLVRDFIPAKLGGVAGMWDRKECKFYKSAQNGKLFEEGPVVASEPGDFAVTHSVTAGEGGTATISDPEAELGTSVTLTATPAAGYAFAGWMGNVPAAHAASATATFAVTEPLAVQATFAADVPYVVDPAGGGNFTTLDEAVTALAGKAGTLQVKAGVYTVTNTLALTGGLTIVPESGRLGDVTVGAGAADMFTVVELAHPLARLSNLVISNGYTQSAVKGGNVTMSAGLVENCLITAGRMTGGAASAGVYMTGGLLRNSTIRGNMTVGDRGDAVGVYAKGVDALVENCDVSCNTNLMNYQLGMLIHSGGIKLDGGTVRNCFVTNNVNLGHGNLYVTGGGRVEDTLVADNVGGFYFDTLSGGGFVPTGGSATFVRTTFARNSGYGIGGLYAGGTVTLTGVKAYGNTAVLGGTDGNMDVRGCSTAGIDFTDPSETPVERVADVYVPADTSDLREAVRRCADGGTVHVASGAYPLAGEVVVDRPIRITGEGADTTSFYRDPSVWYTRLFNLRHAEAVLEGVAVSNGQRLAANTVNVFRGMVRNALLSDSLNESACMVWAGGTVRGTIFTRLNGGCNYSGHGVAASLMEEGSVLEDCVFERNSPVPYGSDNLANVFAGVLRRSVFRDNYVPGTTSSCIGLKGPGVVESTLVTHNDGSWYSAGGFTVAGVGWEVRNCTVVSNLSEYAGAAVYWATNQFSTAVRQGSFVNCIFYRNRCTKDKFPEYFDVSAGNGTKNIDVTFRNCLFTTAEAAAAQGARAIDSLSGDPAFRSLERRDYRLSAGSPCRNAGYLWKGADDPSVTDITGRRLSESKRIDVGCYSAGHGGLAIVVR